MELTYQQGKDGQIRYFYPPLETTETIDTRSETGPKFCNKEVANTPTDMPLV